MATTKINIVNRALGLLGHEFITSLTEDTKAARFSNELFDEYQNEESTCYTLLVDQNFSNYASYDDNVSDHRPVMISLKIN